ncbi:MAG TPA: cytochrome c maturation protein CcmE [Anaerolineae bacterium]
MNSKLIIGVLVLLPVLAHLAYATVNSPVADYYITVDQYAERSANSAVRVGGQIVPGTIRWDNATRTMHFQLAGDTAKVDVVYRGAAPDSFRDGFTAILEGARGADGSLIATTLMIKCPHQYLPAG